MRKRFNREYFENLYGRSRDPWSYETSSYERNKYERTLEVLAHRRYHRALEVGCSIGMFTAMLAPLCDELLAVDISEKAIVAARERLANFAHVSVERRTLPEEMPEGPFDLVVASEILYYLPTDIMLVALRRFEEVLSPGGVLITANARPKRRRRAAEKIRPLFLRRLVLRDRPLLGEKVHEILLEHTRLSNTVSLIEPKYRLDLFENS